MMDDDDMQHPRMHSTQAYNAFNDASEAQVRLRREREREMNYAAEAIDGANEADTQKHHRQFDIF